MATGVFELRWVYQQTMSRGGRKHEIGQRPALCVRGRKHAMCVCAGHPVHVLKRPVEAYDRYRVVNEIPPLPGGAPTPEGETPKGARPYDVGRALETLRGIAARNGVTVGAQKLIDRAHEWVTSGSKSDLIINDDDYDDEEDLIVENNAPVSDKSTEEKPTVETQTTSSSKKSGGAKRVPAKKAASKPAAKKAAPKAAAKKGNGGAKVKAKANGAKRGSAPRAGSITELVVQMTKEGKDKKAIGQAVAKKFSDTTFAKEVRGGDFHAVGYYQRIGEKRGWLKK